MSGLQLHVAVHFKVTVEVLAGDKDDARVFRVEGHAVRDGVLVIVLYNVGNDEALLVPEPDNNAVVAVVALAGQCHEVLHQFVLTQREA